jgi:hypothetical protein
MDDGFPQLQHRNIDTSQQTSFLAVYNLETSKMLAFYQVCSSWYILQTLFAFCLANCRGASAGFFSCGCCLNHMLKLWLSCVNWYQGQWWIALVILYKIWSVMVLLLALLSSASARIQQRRCCSWWSITTIISEWPFQSQHIWISSQVMETTFFLRSNCGSRRPRVSLAEATSFHRYPFSLLLWFSFWSPPEEFMSYDTWCTITLLQMDL